MIQLALTDWRPPARPEHVAAPIVKWVGGKGRLLPELLARVPWAFGRYFEPFAGGAALFFALRPERATLGDANADLIWLYRALVEDVEGAIGGVRVHERLHTEAHYYATREAWNARAWDGEPLARAAAMVYLNRACFNGLWRVNASGDMNAPIGRRADGELHRLEVDAERLRAASQALARAELHAGDYRAALRGARAGDFVYFDPPYDGTFTSYTAGAFGPDEQCELAAVVRRLIRRGVRVMLSNADTPRVRELYAGLWIDVVQRPGTVSCAGARRQAVDEVIVCGGYDPGGGPGERRATNAAARGEKARG